MWYILAIGGTNHSCLEDGLRPPPTPTNRPSPANAAKQMSAYPDKAKFEIELANLANGVSIMLPSLKWSPKTNGQMFMRQNIHANTKTATPAKNPWSDEARIPGPSLDLLCLDWGPIE